MSSLIEVHCNVYRNGLKNREFDKEVPATCCLERVKRQTTFEYNPTKQYSGLRFALSGGYMSELQECAFFLQELDHKIQSKHLLKHPFYQAWSRGMLSLECLQEYAKEYYQHVKAFPTYISAIHARSDDQNTRSVLLKNLIEEEAGFPNHPELWKRFTLSLGVTEEELLDHTPNKDIESLIHTFRTICSQKCLASAIASLYAYESQIPEICVSKIEGLKEHYGMADPAAWHYFTVHMQADTEHAAEEKGLLQKLFSSKEMQEISHSVNAVLDALWNFLSGLCHRYHIACERSM